VTRVRRLCRNPPVHRRLGARRGLRFFGGVGTDPNSMIPMSLVVVAGYLAMTRVPAVVGAPVPITTAVGDDSSFWARLASRPAYAFRSIAALAAIGITLIGVVPMAAASVNPNADPIIAEAVDGPPGVVNTPAPGFRLVDQNGATVSAAEPPWQGGRRDVPRSVCVSDCPLIAQEFRQADGLLDRPLAGSRSWPSWPTRSIVRARIWSLSIVRRVCSSSRTGTFSLVRVPS